MKIYLVAWDNCESCEDHSHGIKCACASYDRAVRYIETERKATLADYDYDGHQVWIGKVSWWQYEYTIIEMDVLM